MLALQDDGFCFACGGRNKQGLRVRWQQEGPRMWTEYKAPKKFQGWQGVMHGGIVAALCDEAMTRLAWLYAGGAVTAEMTVRFVKPVPIGKKIFVEGEVLSVKGRIIYCRAAIYLAHRNGELLAKSEGKAFIRK